MVEAILLIVTVLMFGISMVMLGRAKHVHGENKKEIENLKVAMESTTETCKQLGSLFSTLNESHKLQLKALEILLKSQKMTSTDLNEFKDHVANVIVSIVEQITATGKNNPISSGKKDGKLN